MRNFANAFSHLRPSHIKLTNNELKNALKYDIDEEILTEDIIRVLRTACFGAGSSLSMIGAM